MCFSYHASVFSFVVGIISSTILYKYNPTAAIYLGWAVLMQLYDIIFWKHLGENTINYVFTKIAMISNILQPIVLAIAIKTILKRDFNIAEKIIITIYAIYSAFFVLYKWNKTNYTLLYKNSLDWKWLDNEYNISSIFLVIYLILSYTLIFNHFEKYTAIILSIAITFTLILGTNYYKQRAVGRFWCYFASFIPIILLVALYINNKNTR